MIPHSSAYFFLLAALAALPLAALGWAGRSGAADPRAIHAARPVAPSRALLSFALMLAALVWADRLRGVPAVLGGAALLYGFLAGAGGMRRFHRLRYGAAFADRHPELAARDALRLHLFMMILAVACFTAGIIFVTLPRPS